MVLYAGIDVHKEQCTATILNEVGVVVKQFSFLTTSDGMNDALVDLRGCESVLEACSTYRPVYKFLASNGVDVVVAHPLKVKLISESRSKTDKKDSHILADLRRTNSVPRAYVPNLEEQELRTMGRHRRSLSEGLVKVKQKVKALLLSEGVRYDDFSDLFGKGGLKFLGIVEVSVAARQTLNDHLELIGLYQRLIGERQKEMEVLCDEDNKSTGLDGNAKLLCTIPGVGEYSAVALIGEIGDVKRFPDASRLASYFGVVPTVSQSGDRTTIGSITRNGSSLGRFLLVQNARVAIKYSKTLRKFYRKIKRKKGDQVAIMAVAHKIVKYIYWVLSNKKEFTIV